MQKVNFRGEVQVFEAFVNNRLLIIYSNSRCTFLDSESATGLCFPGIYAALTQLFRSMQNSHNCFVKVLHNSE